MTLPLQQSPTFAAALRAFGADLTSTAPVVMQRRFGPLRVDFASRIKPEALQTRPRVVNAETQAPHAWRTLGYRQIITPVHVAEWSLTGDLRTGLHGKWRNGLRRAEKAALRLRIALWDGSDHPLFLASDAQAQKARFRALPRGLLAAFAKAAPADALMVEAFDKGHLCGACLVLRHGSSATFQRAWSNANGRQKEAARFILFGAACHLQKRGVRLFDLGNVETDTAPGLARFKLGTGAQPRALGGTWLRLP